MDEEEEQSSRGAYANMEGPNIRPDFAANALGNNAKNLFRNSEESAKNTARDIGQKAGEKVAGKVAEKGLDAVTGGVGGKVLKAAEKSGVAQNAMSLNPKTSGKAKIKKALPIVVILCVVMGGFGVLGTSTFSLFGKAFSSLMKDSDMTATVNHKVTDYQMNNTQLGGNNGSSEYGEVVFEDVGFSNYQLQALKQAGFDYVENDGQKALVYTNYDGTTYITADSAVTGAIYYGDEVVGEGNEEYVDAGASDGKTEAERIEDIKIALNVPDGARVIKYSDLFKNFNIKNAFIAATESYRGGLGAWYNDGAKTTSRRLGISLNNWRNFEDTGDNAANEQIVIETAAGKSGDSENRMDKSYKDLTEEIAANSGSSEGCGYDSTATVVTSIANSAETYKQVNASALIMESIDKTIAGEGSKAPMNAIMNLIFKAGGTDTESMHHLFSNNGKLSQSSSDILSTSAQANLGGSGTGSVNLGALSDEAQTEAQTCMYVGDVNNHELRGFIPKIGNMFKKIGSWVLGKLNDVKNFFTNFIGELSQSATETIVSAIDPAVTVFEQMKNHAYLTGNDDKLIGEAMVSGTELITNEMSKSVTATMVGDTGAALTAYRAQQEVIAEKAEYERSTLSPFDPSSENTFFGKIAYSLIPFATSNTAFSLTSTISSFGSILSQAATSLLPTSSALSETALQSNQGDCAFANSIAAYSNARCHNYQTFDIDSLLKDPTAIFNAVAKMRIDEEDGYRFGINKSEVEYGLEIDYDDGNGRELLAADYGNEPLNPEESNMESHWGTGGKEAYGGTVPHGCESDWQWEYDKTRPTAYDNLGNAIDWVKVYHFDKPSEWKYTRLTNFEYEGYKTGYPNRTAATTPEKEGAKNDVDPGTCQLDLKTDRQKQPVINMNGMLGMFILMSGHRTSEFGVADQGNIDRLTQVDFLHGRLHPCSVDSELLCDEFVDNNGWNNTEEAVSESEFLSRLISGSAFTNFTDNITGMVKGFIDNKIFEDPSQSNSRFIDEMKLYSSYLSLINWMEANNLLTQAGDSVALEKYYKENPLDNSYEGILARYSGYSKDTVIAVLDLVNYAEFLASYDPTDLYPLSPKEDYTLEYDNPEIIANNAPVIDNEIIIYDELRNRAVAI